jgi:hypothetical protein
MLMSLLEDAIFHEIFAIIGDARVCSGLMNNENSQSKKSKRLTTVSRNVKLKIG